MIEGYGATLTFRRQTWLRQQAIEFINTGRLDEWPHVLADLLEEHGYFHLPYKLRFHAGDDPGGHATLSMMAGWIRSSFDLPPIVARGRDGDSWKSEYAKAFGDTFYRIGCSD